MIVAQNTNGIARILTGDCLRAKNTLFEIEVPRLQSLGKVQCIFQYSAATEFEVPTIYWQQKDNGYCLQQLKYEKLALACLTYDKAQWRTSQDENLFFDAGYVLSDCTHVNSETRLDLC